MKKKWNNIYFWKQFHSPIAVCSVCFFILTDGVSVSILNPRFQIKSKQNKNTPAINMIFFLNHLNGTKQ
jgi:hypothetical protein